MAAPAPAQGIRLTIDNRLYDKLRSRLGRDDDFRASYQVVKQASKANGRIGPAALREAFRRLMLENLDDATSAALFQRMDHDGDGELSPGDLQAWGHHARTKHTYLVKETPQYHGLPGPGSKAEPRVAARARSLFAKLLAKVQQLRGGSVEAMVAFPLGTSLALEDIRAGMEKLVGTAPDEVLAALMDHIGSQPNGEVLRTDLRRAMGEDFAVMPERDVGFHRSGLGIHLPKYSGGFPKPVALDEVDHVLPSWIEKGGAKRYHESAPAWETQRLSAQVLRRQDLAKVPGYQGFVPGFRLTVGCTFADAATNAATKRRSDLIHNPENLPNVGPECNRRARHERFGVPGYGGHIAGNRSDRLVGTSPWANHLLFKEEQEHNVVVDQELEEARKALNAYVADHSSLLGAFRGLGADANDVIPKEAFLKHLEAQCGCAWSTNAVADEVFAALDADADGAISMVDFVRCCM